MKYSIKQALADMTAKYEAYPQAEKELAKLNYAYLLDGRIDEEMLRLTREMFHKARSYGIIDNDEDLNDILVLFAGTPEDFFSQEFPAIAFSTELAIELSSIVKDVEAIKECGLFDDDELIKVMVMDMHIEQRDSGRSRIPQPSMN